MTTHIHNTYIHTILSAQTQHTHVRTCHMVMLYPSLLPLIQSVHDLTPWTVSPPYAWVCQSLLGEGKMHSHTTKKQTAEQCTGQNKKKQHMKKTKTSQEVASQQLTASWHMLGGVNTKQPAARPNGKVNRQGNTHTKGTLRKLPVAILEGGVRVGVQEKNTRVASASGHPRRSDVQGTGRGKQNVSETGGGGRGQHRALLNKQQGARGQGNISHHPTARNNPKGSEPQLREQKQEGRRHWKQSQQSTQETIEENDRLVLKIKKSRGRKRRKGTNKGTQHIIRMICVLSVLMLLRPIMNVPKNKQGKRRKDNNKRTHHIIRVIWELLVMIVVRTVIKISSTKQHTISSGRPDEMVELIKELLLFFER